MSQNAGSFEIRKQRLGALLQQGRLREAQELLTQLCRHKDADARLWLLNGAVNQELNKLAQAEQAYIQAAVLAPEDAKTHYQLGTLYLETGKFEPAIESLSRATRLAPELAEAFGNLGMALESAGRHAEAIEQYRRALQLRPDLGMLHYNLGNAFQALGKHAEAETCYLEALRREPNRPEIYDHIGVVYASQNQHDKALTYYQRALAINPGYALAHYNAGLSLKKLGRNAEAISSYRQALSINPKDADGYINLGAALAEERRFEESLEACRQALALKPNDAKALCNVGFALRGLGRRQDAEIYYRHAIDSDPKYPEGHFGLATLLLLGARFREGWEEYQWTWRESAVSRPFSPSPWDGSPLDGRPVFLHGEQGIGDELFFLRFVPWLKRQGAGCVTCQPNPKIASLLARVPIIDRIVPAGKHPNPGELIFSVGDLPWLLRMENTAQIPPSLTIAPQTELLVSLKQRLEQLGPPPYLGVTWRAGTAARGSLFKESPVSSLARLLHDLPGTVLVLQRQPLASEISAFKQVLGRAAHDLSTLNDDLEQMLALLALIDDYVGVSNTNMHLRAAVGKTARVLVPAPPEWRWMAEGKESPWFPGFGVYRQGYDGSWEGALTQLKSDLHDASWHGRR